MDAVRRERLHRRREAAAERLKRGRAGVPPAKLLEDLLRHLGIVETDRSDEQEAADLAERDLAKDRLAAVRAYLESKADHEPLPAAVIRRLLPALGGPHVDAPVADPVAAQRLAQAKAWLRGRLTSGAPGTDPATLADVRALAVVLASLLD